MSEAMRRLPALQGANGASEVLLQLFGERNSPAHSALGVDTLPMGLPGEIDSICTAALIPRRL